MRNLLRKLYLCLSLLVCVPLYAKTITYGHNSNASGTMTRDSAKVYYETYGSGKPLLLLHPNGGSIGAMKSMIEEFRKDHRVIAMDNRGHGRSTSGGASLTYEQMAEDANALLERLNIKQAEVVGWSDGGVIALMLASRYPDKVTKMVVMGANTTPEGAAPWAIKMVTEMDELFKQMQASQNHTQDWQLKRQQMDLLLNQPHISNGDLKKIQAQTLVMAGDRDIIKTEHTVHIFDEIKRSNLLIVPGATHFLLAEEPKRFNRIVREFLESNFKQPSSESALMN